MFTRSTAMVSTSSVALQAPDTERNTSNIDGDALATLAQELGARVSTETEDTIAIVSRAKEDWQGGPFKVLIRLLQDFTEEEIADKFALPDSDTGTNPDEFKKSKEDAKGKVKLVAAHFYVEFSSGTPAGQNYLSRVEWCERMQDDKAMKDDVPDDIKNMDPHELENEIKFCKTRLLTMANSYKKSAALFFKIREVSAYPGITCEPQWVKGKEGEEVQNVPEPIAIWVTPDEGKPVLKWKSMTISSFLRLNPNKALEKGGTFLQLIESGAVPKKAGSGANSDNGDGFVIKTMDKGISVLAEFHRWTEEIGEAKDKAEIGKLYKLMNTKGNDELIVAMCETAAFLNAIISDTGAGQKYIKLQQGGSELVKDVVKSAA